MPWSLVMLLLLSLTTFVWANKVLHEAYPDPDYNLTVTEIINARGYDVEVHKVTTVDGYILTMYRLPKSYRECQRNTAVVAKKPAVYLIHGLLDSSYTFVCNFRNQSLAYVLADAGYDVWLGNNRGTTWSNQHVTYTTDNYEYWDFSWQEMALYDMPAMLHYVLNETQHATLSYVGHSEGTMQAFAGFSINQNLAKKVSFLGALAPVANVGHVSSPIFKLMSIFGVDVIYAILGIHAFGSRNWLLEQLMGWYKCSTPHECISIVNLITGPSNGINMTRVPVYVSQTPAGTSVKNMAHFAQGMRANTFRYYDYGCMCLEYLGLAHCPTFMCPNKQIYGTFKPPAFDLSAVQYPRMGFYSGTDDWLATDADILQIRAGLKNATIVSNLSVKYSHIDFTWGYTANELVYQDLLSQIAKFDSIGYE
ncbi:hypothetical protein CCR75_002314 [Bremia lactucae]|uniref:Lipase n=1 Tax=Bremia lactucae TaxID=4779 RepID=A0A976FIA3_BRELC|nr:hypothetical protein CCR75_002314 [Bremia lactucae]